MSTKDFRAAIFNEGSTTCYTESPHGVVVKVNPSAKDLFFCINELYPDRDANPTKDWHSATIPRRADCNVSCFRNFLIEIDDMALEDQIAYVKSRLPVTTIVYSGGSSYHFIISLETPLPDYDTYMSWSRRLLKLVPLADPACKNPSRLSRLPERLRLDTGKMQTLVYTGLRIPNEQIASKLQAEIPFVKREYTPEQKRSYVTPLIQLAAINPDETMDERGIRGRNAFFFWLYNRFEEISMEVEKRQYYVEVAYNNLRDTKDFTLSEAYMAARVGVN